MSDKVLDRIAQVKRQIEVVRLARAKKEAAAEQAESVVRASEAKLKELGCDSPEAAQIEAERLGKALAGAIEDIETKLREASR